MTPEATPPEDDLSRTARGWSVQGVGKRWQLWFFHTLIRLGGRRPAYHIMYIIVMWYVLFVPSIRRRTRHYLERRFPGRLGPLRRFWQSYRLVYTFGRTMIDRAALALVGPSALSASCPSIEEIRKIVEESDGAVLLNAHIGCWQVAMTTLGYLEREVSVVMIPPEGNAPMSLLRERGLPFEIVDPRRGLASILEMMKALQKGRILGLMGDRVFGAEEDAVPATFLGGEIELPISPYRLAGATGKPIVLLFSHKVGFSTYEVRLAGVIRVPEKARAPEQCRAAAQQFGDALEAFVQEHPWQFFNFYDMWSGKREAADLTGENA